MRVLQPNATFTDPVASAVSAMHVDGQAMSWVGLVGLSKYQPPAAVQAAIEPTNGTVDADMPVGV
jgi:hypothetical protein